ncbi:MAG: LCP family protein, partial [Vallitaleaceae bacterium]|nr:LCP family protein [Vallitaleaceae bacterium]
MDENRGHKKKGNRLLGKFLRVFLLAFTVLVLIVAIGAGVYILLARNSDDKGNKTKDPSDSETVTDKNGEVTKGNDLEKITTFAIFGTDIEGYRTDVVMLLFFNKETKKINIISIPRDTMVSIPDDLYESILTKRSDMNKTIKVNEIPAYVEKDERNESSVKVLESMLGYDIDYYMNLNLDGFKTIVDLVGPIEVNIPFDMVYSDPIQDLYINLKAGVQEINGAQAEELIRYRKGYNNGDLGRIDMQHEFMKAFVKKLLSVENKMNIVNIAAAVLVNLETNFDSAINYVNYIDDVSPENITIDVLPGEAQMLDRSYYVYDYEATKLLLNNIVNGTLELVDPETLVDAKTLSISVQNGAGISGLARSFKEKLLGEGYKVTEATDYTSSDVVTTKLLVPTEAVGDELATYFDNPVIEVDKTL